MLTSQQRDALADALDGGKLQIRNSLLTWADATWRALPDHRDSSVARFEQAAIPRVQSAAAKTAGLTDAMLARAYADGEGLAGTVDVTRMRAGVPLAEEYHRPAVTLYSELKGGSTYGAAVDAGAARLASLISMDLQLASTQQAAASTRGRRAAKGGFRRVLTGRENCALCLIASTQRYHRGDLMPIHPGCVPGDSVVTPIAGGSAKLSDFAWGEVEAVSRRLFEGELIEFVTSAGDEVRVTPNHPVLTEKGWLPAHLLSEGDTVFSSGIAERVVIGGPDVDERPALAQDVFDAARMAFPLVSVPLAPEDFHADAANGEVEIVYTHGNFPTPRNTERVEGRGESFLVDAHGGRLPLNRGGTLGALSPCGHPALTGDVCGVELGASFVGAHVGGTDKTSVRPSTRFDAPADKFGLESAPVYASQGLSLIGRLSSEVEGDRIVELRRVSFSGHVFNLHTREGWYSSNNHIVSNCDCGVKPLAPGENTGQVIDPERLEATQNWIGATQGTADRSGRSLGFGKEITGSRGLTQADYTDLIVTRQHGEFGPTLSWRRHSFIGPADL